MLTQPHGVPVPRLAHHPRRRPRRPPTGGRTDLADLVLLCSFHHHRAHDHHFDTTYHPTGTVTFHRRT